MFWILPFYWFYNVAIIITKFQFVYAKYKCLVGVTSFRIDGKLIPGNVGITYGANKLNKILGSIAERPSYFSSQVCKQQQITSGS